MITVLVSLPLLGHSVWQSRQLGILRSLYSFSGPASSPAPSFPHLTPQQKLLLLGDVNAASQSGKWKPLWDSDPASPVYLARYATAYIGEHGELSPEILDAAKQLDPDNAWFPALAAAGMVEKAVTKERSSFSGKSKAVRPAPVWKIDDEKRLQDILAAIHQFAGKPRFTGYQKELLRQQISLLPPRRDFVSQILPMVYAASLPSGSIRFRKLTDALAAGAQQCAVNGDVAGFRQITGDWRLLTEAVVRGGETLVDGLVAKVMIMGPVANFRDAAKTLGLEEDAAYFGELYDDSQQEKDDREKRAKARSADEDFITRHSSFLGGLTIPMLARQVKTPPVLTENDLRPGRYADHALFERFCTWPAWLLLGICAGMAVLARYRQGPLARRLSLRMVDLLHPSDWAWVMLGGVVFPVIWYFLITRLTPLSGREWSARASMFIQQGGQFGCMALSMIILPGVIAGWRLAKRGTVFGLRKRRPWIGGVMAVATLAGVPAFGAVMLWGQMGDLLKYEGLLVAASAGIWFLVGFAHHVFGRESQALRRATLARIVWPTWVFGMLVMMALVPFHYAEERRWIQQDEIFKFSPELPGLNRYEYDVMQILRGELLEMIGRAEKIR